MGGNMILRRTVIYLCLSYFTIGSASLFSLDGIRSYAKYLDWDTLGTNSSGNELWNGIIKDCSRRMTLSCIQKNAYTYLDNTFVERDNITVFEGFVLRRNGLDYEKMTMKSEERRDVNENLVETTSDDDRSSLKEDGQPQSSVPVEKEQEIHAEHREEYKTPLEEITSALHEKTVQFLATRDYELQLPDFFFEGSTVKISPREIDEKGALVRVDFGNRGLEEQGRLFKKLKKYIQNKLLMSFLALLLIIKLIKVKFMFVIPFLFGIGTAKKLFLKLLLFMVPAFAHVFKLCSSYYSNNSQKFHHHHHKIAHHHHHVPVPVPVPTYYAPHHNHPHHPHHEEEFEGYDYAHPHIQLRKDMEELKEWGIEPNEEHFDDPGLRPVPNHPSLSPVYPGNSHPIPPPTLGVRPPGVLYQDKYSVTNGAHAQHLAYNGYTDEHKFNRRTSVQSPLGVASLSQVSQVPGGSINIQAQASSPINLRPTNLAASSIKTNSKTPYNVFPQQTVNIPHQVNQVQQVSRPIQQVQTQRVVQQPVQTSVGVASPLTQSNNRAAYDDDFYGPILERLDDTFAQLRFVDENCRERLICSMYKNPALYSPHSNLVSNELSRDPQELKRGVVGSNSSQRFQRYLNAARLGQDGGDCLRTYPCQINTE